MTGAPHKPLQVWMLDLTTQVPYYDAALAEALARAGVDLRLCAITYHLDPRFFASRGLNLHPGFLNISGRMGIKNRLARRVVKTGELLLNLLGVVTLAVLRKPDLVHVQFFGLLQHGLTVEL